MSASILDSILGHISTWATENATWTGRFHHSTITLTAIHPLSEISDLTLRLGGTSSIRMPTPQTDLSLQMSRCGCCFDLGTSDNHIWCRFQSCHQHNLKSTSIDTLLSKVIPNRVIQRQTQRFILFKNTEPFSCDMLTPTIQHVELFHCKTESTLSIPNHISTLNIVHLEDIQTIEGLESNPTLHTFAVSWCKKLNTISEIASDRLKSIKIHWCQRLEHIPSLQQSTLKTLDIQACQSLKHLPNIRLCTNLEEIRFCWFSQNITIPSLAACHKLRFLTLRSMSTMKVLPNFSTSV